jgi:glucuronoarabinoxylan endo-1,4-beta-xylanase
MFSKIRSSIFALTVFMTLLISVNSSGQTSTVNWTEVHQQIDGWGGSDWISAESLTTSQAAMFFSPTTGIGLEYVHTNNYACPETGSCAVSTSNVPDLVTLQEVVANGAKVWVGIQPPANLQYGGNFWNGTADPSTGNCIDSNHWAAFATFTVDWIELLNANSAPVSVLSVAGEPNFTQADSLGACQWTAAGLDSYIAGYLGPALVSAGLSSVKVAMPEASDWFNTDLVSTCLNDSKCSQYVSIAEGHDYGLGGVDGTNNGYCCLTATAPPSSTNGKHIWMSEVNGGFTYNSTAGLWDWDPSMADALVWAHNMHDFLTIANVSGWTYWELADCCETELGSPLNDGLTNAAFATSKRYYMVGQWSKFVRNGYYRVDSTTNPQPGVYVTAFQSTPSDTLVIVAVNTNGSNTPQSFKVTDAPTFSTMTPYVTSASLSLSAQAAVSLSANTFTYTLPLESVTTFVGSSTMQPPTGLTAQAH